jgi:integrase
MSKALTAEVKRIRATGTNPTYIFSPGTSYPSAKNWADAVHDTCKRAGVTDISFHGLRDTYASTRLGIRKESILLVAKSMGDTVATVEKAYAFILPSSLGAIDDEG